MNKIRYSLLIKTHHTWHKIQSFKNVPTYPMIEQALRYYMGRWRTSKGDWKVVKKTISYKDIMSGDLTSI